MHYLGFAKGNFTPLRYKCWAINDWILLFLCCVVAGVFGQHLEETMLHEAQSGHQRLVPVLVEQCVCFIREHGLQEEGLFRAPGQTNHVRELQDAFDRGEKPVFDRWRTGRGISFAAGCQAENCTGWNSSRLFSYSATDVHTVASLLKLYIRELPEPIIPFSKYTQFLSCAQLLTKDKAMVTAHLLSTKFTRNVCDNKKSNLFFHSRLSRSWANRWNLFLRSTITSSNTSAGE